MEEGDISLPYIAVLFQYRDQAYTMLYSSVWMITTVKPILRDQVPWDYIFGRKSNYTSQPVLRDHILMANGVVSQHRLSVYILTTTCHDAQNRKLWWQHLCHTLYPWAARLITGTAVQPYLWISSTFSPFTNCPCGTDTDVDRDSIFSLGNFTMATFRV